MGVDVRRHEVVLEGGGPQRRRPADRDRTVVGRPVRQAGLAAVRRVADDGVDGGAGDGHGDGSVVEAAVRLERRVLDEVDEGGGVGGSRRRLLEEPLRHGPHGDLRELREDQEIAAVETVVETVKGEDVPARSQEPQVLRHIDLLVRGRLARRAIGGGRRVESDRGRSVPPGDLDAVQVGDETVVVLRPQGERLMGQGVEHVEGKPHIRRGACIAHQGVDVRADEVAEGREGAELAGIGVDGEAPASAEEAEAAVPGTVAAARREELDLGAAAALVEDEAQVVVAGPAEVEDRQAVAGTARRGELEPERLSVADDVQTETIVRADPERPRARGWHGDGRPRLDDEVVHVLADDGPGKRVVAGVVTPAACVVVVDDLGDLGGDLRLGGGIAQDVLGGRQAADSAARQDGPHAEAGLRAHVSHTGRAVDPPRVVEGLGAAGPARPQAALLRDQDPCHRQARDQGVHVEVLADTVREVGTLLGIRRVLVNHRLAVGRHQREVLAGGPEPEIRVELGAGETAVVAGGEDEDASAPVEDQRRKAPLPQHVGVVRQIVALEVDGLEPLVVDLEPVGGVAVLVDEGRAVDGHELADDEVVRLDRLATARGEDGEDESDGPGTRRTSRRTHDPVPASKNDR